MTTHRLATLLLCVPAIAGLLVAAEPLAKNQRVDFVRDIQPILAKNCQGCHGPEKQKGGLRLDSSKAARLGGDTGPAIVPGKTKASILLQRVSDLGDGHAMPPGDKRLPPATIALLRVWIEQGADWPETSAAATRAANHWSYQPIRKPAVPKVRDRAWVRVPLDAFVKANLEKQEIAPSLEADRVTLLRRLYLDLIGLPPTLAEIDAFLKAHGKPAVGIDPLDAVVDDLLSRPHFGERWGQHWLDLARYADSDGYENDNPRKAAAIWRDWVIAAINKDLPYDQFTIQQIAGDLLPGATPEQKTATGFHRNSLSNSAGGADAEEFRSKGVKDRLDAVGAAWLGLTVGCAQCHTHKYDPISHREYYQFYAFFNETGDAAVAVPGGKASVLALQPRVTRIHLRGDFLKPGDEVKADTPAFLPPLKPRSPKPDRLDLARWLVDPAHPLTARVAVNHIWHHLFGKGLVPTPDNFGIKGEPPLHGELLDHLATEFREVKWSRKELIRRIVRSATYRQSSRYRADLAERDPGNTHLARQNRYVVEAEVVRDLALASSGLLNAKLGGASVQPPLPAGLKVLRELKSERFMEESAGDSRYRRGVYVNRQRTFPYPSLLTFDCPDGNAACVQRDRSTTPMQALTLLNDPAFHECAQALARRFLTTQALGSNERLQRAFQLCLTRLPNEEEAEVVTALLNQRRAVFATDPKAAAKIAGPGKLPASVNVVEAAAWVSVARTLINLEEFITRE